MYSGGHLPTFRTKIRSQCSGAKNRPSKRNYSAKFSTLNVWVVSSLETTVNFTILYDITSKQVLISGSGRFKWAIFCGCVTTQEPI
jgi:hypothetical protein